MIITVTQTVIVGDKRIEKTATAQIDRRGPFSLSDGDMITNTAGALFDSLEIPNSHFINPISR
jgi:hypothetical protein